MIDTERNANTKAPAITLAIAASVPRGAKVELCLLEFPTDCPPGDDRGKVYSLLNYRTGFKDDVVDSWHLCGGA